MLVINKTLKIELIVILLCAVSIVSYAQLNPSSSQYLQTQYFLNPAYSGTSNTMAINMMARKQWAGIDGAPTNYQLSVHTPINKTMMSVGGGVRYQQYGINKLYNADLSYAYLLKISPVTFISLGINASYSSFNVGFDQLNVIHDNDPFFAIGNEGASSFNTGAGAFLYGRSFFLGFSASNLFGIQTDNSNESINSLLSTKNYHVVTGYLFHVGRSIGIRPTLKLMYQTSEINELSTGLQFLYKELFWMGAVYNNNGWVSSIINFQIKSDLGLAYAFDFTVSDNSIDRNNHEISLSYNINSLIKKNKKREFGVRKGKKHKEGIKSLRNF
ncbi:PorP/SprF family type IX secretion system membrane protein [Labilibacter marinus]|uniref:PorP/SprF family type IX secretion system membrane protein n=1 Tax=Labilibacter marinus TaxID=1477105 RepID=UPI00082C54E6|nr:PorP/SprF family type IX secretion system membrane protein [Labilibacter marinus]